MPPTLSDAWAAELHEIKQHDGYRIVARKFNRRHDVADDLLRVAVGG